MAMRSPLWEGSRHDDHRSAGDLVRSRHRLGGAQLDGDREILEDLHELGELPRALDHNRAVIHLFVAGLTHEVALPLPASRGPRAVAHGYPGQGASPPDDSILSGSSRKPGLGISRPCLGSDGSVVRNGRIGPRSGANGQIGGDPSAGSGVARRKQDPRSRTRGAGESGWRPWRPAREHVEHPGLPALESARIGRPRRGGAVAADGPAARQGLPGRRPRRACGSPPQPTPESRRGPRPALRARPDRSLPGSSATSDTPRTWGRGATVGRETSQESEEARPSNRVA